MRLHAPRLGAMATAIVILVACAGSDSSDEATENSTSTAPPATDVAATTTIPEPNPTTTSTSSTTTTTTVEASTSTEAPPTSTEPAAPTEELVTAGLIESREAYLYAVYNLDAPDAIERLNATHAAGSPSLDLALDNVQILADNGWLARPNPDVPDTITIESDVTMTDATSAEVTACVVGAGEVYAPATGENAEVIVNGEIEAALDRVTMVLEDGRWKLQEGTNLTTGSGTECLPV